MYKRSALFIALLIIIGLSGCQPRFAPEAVSYLNDSVVLNLLDQMKQAIRAGDRLQWEGLFASGVVIENITPDGVRVVTGFDELAEVMGQYMEYGQGFDVEILSQLVIVSEDGQSAVVNRVSREVWLFEKRYADISSELEHSMEWELINGVPLITRMVRQYRSRSRLTQTELLDIAPMWAGDSGSSNERGMMRY